MRERKGGGKDFEVAIFTLFRFKVLCKVKYFYNSNMGV